MILWFIIVLATVYFTTAIVGWQLSSPRYKGDISDHFNGKQFNNPGNIKAKGLGDLIKWATNRQRGFWEYRDQQSTSIEDITEEMDSGRLRITFINHSTFLIQLKGLNILTDPVWSKRTSPFQWIGPARMRPPGIRFEDLPRIDYVLLSHNHYDHLDIETMKNLWNKFKPQIITPLGIPSFLSKHRVENAIELDWWEEIEVGKNTEIACVPAQHFSGRGSFDRDATLWSGFVIKTTSGSIYFVGDTGYGAFFKEIGERYAPIKVAMIPIGAYKPRWFMSPIHTSPEEAVKVHLDIQAERSIAMHFGTFPLADDGMDEPVSDLKKALNKYHVPEDEFVIFSEGEGASFEY
jgi:L-ascorbate metabolism protein UlaG (beta-lactamase superfamily)